MKTALYLLTGSKLELPQKLLGYESPDWKIESVDLSRKDVDYRAVLEKVFAAESVQVW